ncbi:MAG TPA: protein kinase, partial [Myxococcota bacterium]
MGNPLVIQDRYEVIRRLAIGGMGEIFLAKQINASFSRLAILKTLRPELTEQSDALDQFLDEARVAASLSHPNIVAIYEVGVHAGVHFIAMEYIGGTDIAALARAAQKQKRSIPMRVAAVIARDAAIGLDYAHHARDDAGRSLSVVHRDVSPQNLMIRSDGLVKVVDFGVAMASNQMHETQGDKLKGKIRYMAPEQLLGEDLDGRSDQFSLGVVLWELLVGKPLFHGNNPIDVFQRILAGDPLPPSSANPHLPRALDEIVLRMLAVKKSDRYPRCSDVAHALRTWLDNTGAGLEEEVRGFVDDVAGHAIADRVKDLSPRAVAIHGIGEAVGLPSDTFDDDEHEKSADTSEPTKIVSMRMRRVKGSSTEGSPERSDPGVILDAAETSGVIHGDRRFMTVLVGLLPGWGELAQQIANVPMGAFGVNRLKNLFFRQLQTLAEQKHGAIIRRGPDSFVVAFGLEEPGPQDAEHALGCAFATQKILDDLAKGPRQRLVAHMGIASGTGLATPPDDGPVRIAGSVVERAERMATLARTEKKGILASSAVAGIARDFVKVVDANEEISGESVVEVTGVNDAPALTTVRRKILIADDAVVFRKIEEEILRPFAYAFLHAQDGGQAVKLAVDEKPDLILLDVQM